MVLDVTNMPYGMFTKPREAQHQTDAIKSKGRIKEFWDGGGILGRN